MKRKITYTILMVIILINVVAYIHAYQFSHFDMSEKEKTGKPEDLSFLTKLMVLCTGISNPRPKNKKTPDRKFETLKIKTHHNYTLDAWLLKVAESRGTVLLFHGYAGKKSDLLTEAQVFNELGYNAVLVDFYGSGDSDGNETTVGYFEAQDVASVYEYIKNQNEENIILYGPSMGAVSIANATANYGIKPRAIIMECPYGKLLTTVENRFDIMGVPSIGLAELLVFWGGVQNGYWGFSMNTIEFAKDIEVPTLIMHGKNDKRANFEEV
ncbi:alpha/beta hydrolase, partial [Candidatus Amoebophilus asiaticus]|nr:alpha/beta hydrolase [Candidatus Amoebophilus asiaticus]